jgi:hypothetical protein
VGLTATTPRQLEILKLLAAGAKIPRVEKDATSYAITVNGVVVQRTLINTTHQMAINGWIAFNGEKDGYELTRAGQDVVDVKAFVRAFSTQRESA